MAYNFDSNGLYVDRTNGIGKFFDTFGNTQGQCDADGRYFDASGAFKGTRNEDGMFYDPSGKCLGYTDGKHWCFDAFGVFIASKNMTQETESAEGGEESAEKKSIIDTVREALRRD